ncbi:Uncharacterised protein [Mycobacteroides abscessus subsp. massiliense]|nr:Uncharacterised protein [Mycobacteroides abscessus subsp. massiliense]
MPTQVAQHVQSRVGRVRPALIHGALQRTGPVGHRHVLGQVDVEHDRGGEVADHPIYVGMHRLAMK